MKADIHPDYHQVVFVDSTTGYKLLTGSTRTSNETIEFEGATYPMIRVEVTSDSHPFYTVWLNFKLFNTEKTLNLGWVFFFIYYLMTRDCIIGIIKNPTN